jgi:glycosyltransferase involved in cell wall biosynthesis
MSKPLVSIIIPVYNAESTLEQCLESIFNQTYSAIEIIAVNDGSTDDSLQILEKYRDRIKIITQENSGAPIARNRGAEMATGEYLLFCDADIILAPQAIETMQKTLDQNPKSGYAYSSFRFGGKLFSLWPFDADRLKQMPYIHTTSLIRRELFPGFDQSLKRFQDWDLWLTLLEQGCEGVWIDEVLFTVKSGGTMSSWLPSWAYHIPWLPAVKKYKLAMQIIKHKHHLL